MAQSIFKAAEIVKSYLLASIDKTTIVQKTGFVSIKDDSILFFDSIAQARDLANDGWIFSFIYRNGNIEIKPGNI